MGDDIEYTKTKNKKPGFMSFLGEKASQIGNRVQNSEAGRDAKSGKSRISEIGSRLAMKSSPIGIFNGELPGGDPFSSPRRSSSQGRRRSGGSQRIVVVVQGGRGGKTKRRSSSRRRSSGSNPFGDALF